jgi:SAM-dependent methyltransferase
LSYQDFMSVLHKSTSRDYLARVNEPGFPKGKCAELAKKWDYDYWDGDRRINYGGYRYISGRWERVAQAMIDYYQLPKNAKILDIGCGKGFLLRDFKLLLPEAEVIGIDISSYAIENGHPDVIDKLVNGNCTSLPWGDQYFDLAISINTFHNLYNYELEMAIREIQRVANNKYICVESYATEQQKANLLYWQVTCESFCNPKEWDWWFNHCGYTGDHSFIYFD